jgi:hypothetical protein
VLDVLLRAVGPPAGATRGACFYGFKVKAKRKLYSASY